MATWPQIYERQRVARRPKGVLKVNMRGQSFNNAAFGNGAASALVNDVLEFAPQCFEVGYFAIYGLQLFSRETIHNFAGPGFLIRHPQQGLHLLEAEPEIARSANKTQPTEMSLFVGAVIAACA